MASPPSTSNICQPGSSGMQVLVCWSRLAILLPWRTTTYPQRLARLEFCAGSGRRKGWGLRDVRGVPLPCVTTVSTTSNLGLPRSVTSLGQSTSTLVLASPDDRTTAVCVLPGTELGFSEELQCAPAAFSFTSWRTKAVSFRTAIFRQVNKDVPRVHHDALEFPDGTSVLLTNLLEGQEATVLQLPAQPKTPAEEAAQRRVTYVG